MAIIKITEHQSISVDYFIIFLVLVILVYFLLRKVETPNSYLLEIKDMIKNEQDRHTKQLNEILNAINNKIQND